jgi:hypothetical protein
MAQLNRTNGCLTIGDQQKAKAKRHEVVRRAAKEVQPSVTSRATNRVAMRPKLARRRSGCTVSACQAGGPACGPVAPTIRSQPFAETVGEVRQVVTTPENSDWP